MKTFTAKQPSEDFIVCFDFTSVLLSSDISEVESIIAIDMTDLSDVSETVLDSTKQSNTDKLVYTGVRAGTSGHNYVITCKIVAEDGSDYELDGVLPVIEAPTASTAAISFTIQFRMDFPEFANDTIFTDSSIAFWYGIADKMLNKNRFSTLLTYGMELFVAHNIILAYKDQTQIAAGNISGNVNRIISSNSVGDVSVSYDNNVSAENNAGNWNLTAYGRQLLRIARMVGIGGLQL